MADHSLKSATDRRLGGPLPHQPANQTRVHLVPPEFFTPYHAVLCAYAVLAVVSNCYPPVQGRLPTRYSPVRHSVTMVFLPKDSVQGASFDLHVLSTPPAFILSQDQTLVKSVCFQSRITTSNPIPFTVFRLTFLSVLKFSHSFEIFRVVLSIV